MLQVQPNKTVHIPQKNPNFRRTHEPKQGIRALNSRIGHKIAHFALIFPLFFSPLKEHATIGWVCAGAGAGCS